jgi:DNA repair photolyase
MVPVESNSGRGATRNAIPTRFNLKERVAEGEWLDQVEALDGVPKRRTTVTIEHPKSILTRNTSPDIGFDRSINAFRGCEHGCIYCFARPTHAYHDLSPGVDFESRLFVKPTAAKLLHAALSRPGYECAPIAMGTNTDPYQPIEAEWRITRACIEILAQCRHPLMITTKSDRVLRDLDLLAGMAAQGLVAVGISLTTLDPVLARKMEPRAPHPAKRLAAMRALSEAGVPVNACLSPIIPAINDHEIEALVAAAAEAGVISATNIPVRLPHEVAPLFRQWLDDHFPDRAARVMHHIQSMRGGRDNDPHFGSRMRGSGPYADLIRTRMMAARRRHGLEGARIALRHDLFEAPGAQLRLL